MEITQTQIIPEETALETFERIVGVWKGLVLINTGPGSSVAGKLGMGLKWRGVACRGQRPAAEATR